MHTHSFAQYVPCLERNDWQGVAELMLTSARKLAQAGADFLICPDNTIHNALPYFDSQLPLPWLHIAEVVAERAAGQIVAHPFDHGAGAGCSGGVNVKSGCLARTNDGNRVASAAYTSSAP